MFSKHFQPLIIDHPPKKFKVFLSFSSKRGNNPLIMLEGGKGLDKMEGAEKWGAEGNEVGIEGHSKLGLFLSSGIFLRSISWATCDPARMRLLLCSGCTTAQIATRGQQRIRNGSAGLRQSVWNWPGDQTEASGPEKTSVQLLIIGQGSLACRGPLKVLIWLMTKAVLTAMQRLSWVSSDRGHR